MDRLDRSGHQQHQIIRSTPHLWMRRALLFMLLVVFSLSSQLQADEFEVKLTGVDGKQVKKKLTSIEKETLSFSGDQNADLMNYRELIFTAQNKVDYSSTAARLYLLDGSVIQGEKLMLKDRAIQISLGSHELSIPVEQSLALLNIPLKMPRNATELAAPDVSFTRMMDLEELDADRLYIQNKGKLASLGGAVASIGESRLSFVFNGEKREVKREKVYGVVFAHFLNAAPSRLGKVQVTLTNASVLWLTEVSLKGNQLKGKLGESSISVPAAMIARMKIYSDRVMFLSDMDPINVKSKFFTRQPGDPTWFKDRAANVNGTPNPIRLNGKTYAKGLCILSETSLRYRINGAYDELVASVGIDDETRGMGDCEVVILVDGEEKFRQRFRGSDKKKVHALKIPVAGADLVEITVGFGEDAEFGDHFSMGDARFLKNKD